MKIVGHFLKIVELCLQNGSLVRYPKVSLQLCFTFINNVHAMLENTIQLNF